MSPSKKPAARTTQATKTSNVTVKLPGKSTLLPDPVLTEDVLKVFSQHGLALHDYLQLRSASYEAHQDLYADRARRAELDGRAALAAHLALLNELRDTGQGEILVNELRKKASHVNGVDAATALKMGTAMIGEYRPHLPTDALDVAASYASRVNITIKPATLGLRSELTYGDVTIRRHMLAAPAGPRVSLDDFFGNGPNRVLARTNGSTIPADDIPVDWYSASVADAAFVREVAYRNARSAAELGPPAVRAEGFFEGIFLIILGGLEIVVGYINNAICDGGKVKDACNAAAVLVPVGFATLSAGVVAIAGSNKPQKGTSPPTLNGLDPKYQFGANESPSQ
jgi:hypothetical protein